MASYQGGRTYCHATYTDTSTSTRTRTVQTILHTIYLSYPARTLLLLCYAAISASLSLPLSSSLTILFTFYALILLFSLLLCSPWECQDKETRIPQYDPEHFHFVCLAPARTWEHRRWKPFLTHTEWSVVQIRRWWRRSLTWLCVAQYLVLRHY